jgi:UDP-N-acetylmuramate dehydrogenase
MLVVFPKSQDELIMVVSEAKKRNVKFEIVGNGSNILFSDNGYNGVIIVTKKVCHLDVCSEYINVSCGNKLANVSKIAKDNSLSGMEFGFGIPGTRGGAIAMNAGAYGQEISDVVVSTLAYDTEKKEIIEIKDREHKFSYRNSIYSEKKELICLSAKLRLFPAVKEEIELKMKQNTESRKKSQPLDVPNCGSYFKRPEGYFAAKLIDDCGLKGLSLGGAQVSLKHAGFIVNTGNATSSDVLKLAEKVKATVMDKFGVCLESEVKYIC